MEDSTQEDKDKDKKLIAENKEFNNVDEVFEIFSPSDLYIAGKASGHGISYSYNHYLKLNVDDNKYMDPTVYTFDGKISREAKTLIEALGVECK